MAKLGVEKTPGSILTLLSLVAFLGLLIYASVAKAMHLSGPEPGGFLYLLGAVATAAGFATKEDSVVMGGIAGLSMLVMLDIYLKVGVL